MNDINDKPTLRESLAVAGNTSDLTVSPDQRGAADVLIAAGMSSYVIGRYLDQLVSEWDVCVPPRRLNKDDIERLAHEMPRVPMDRSGKIVMALDIRGATVAAQEWADTGRRNVVSRLKSIAKLADDDSGVMPWMRSKGIENPKRVLLDVLAWYLDRQCAVCHGTKWELAPGTNRQTGSMCRACRGAGERDTPHGKSGRMLLQYLTESSEKARATTRAALRNIRNLKAYAAGRTI